MEILLHFMSSILVVMVKRRKEPDPLTLFSTRFPTISATNLSWLGRQIREIISLALS